MAQRRPLVRSRSQTYLILVGVVVGMLIAGLAVPLVFGHSGTVRRTTSVGAGPASAGAASSGAGRGSTGTVTTAVGPVGGAVATGSGVSGAGAGSGVSGASASSSGASSAKTVSGGSTGANTATTLAGTAAAASGDPIKLGVLLLNIGNISAIGFGGGAGLSPAEQQTVWQALIDDINKAGGVNGRPLKPVFQTYDPLSDDDMRAACLALTRDAKSFLVVDAGGFVGPSVVCISDENKTPFILTSSSGLPQEYYRQSNGRLFSIFMGADRAMHNFVAELAHMGVPKTAKIGILADYHDNTKETPDLMQQYLQQAGYTVAYRNDLSGDLQTGSSQMPVEVSQMRSHGVDTVLNISNAVYITQFVQEADTQQWHPMYVSNDWQGGSTNFYFQNMPDDFDGSPVLTTTRVDESKVNRPEPPADAACIKRSAAALNTTVDRDTDAYGFYVRICSIVALMQGGLKAGGTPLTVDSFDNGMHQLGRLNLPGFGGGSLVPGRFDAADYVRTVRWRSSCKCLLPVDDFRPTQF